MAAVVGVGRVTVADLLVVRTDVGVGRRLAGRAGGQEARPVAARRQSSTGERDEVVANNKKKRGWALVVGLSLIHI